MIMYVFYTMHLLYSFELKKPLLIAGAVLFLCVVFTGNSYAAITGAKDTISTSRPSPSTPLNAAIASIDTQATVYNNGSRFLASDSAKVIRQLPTPLVRDQSTIIASQSANLATVFFGEQAGAVGHAGADVLFVPITAMHTVEFTVGTQIPVSGIFQLTFPTLSAGDADNDASPSATTFQFNNIISGGAGPVEVWNVTDNAEITANVTLAETEPSAGSGGLLTFTLDGATDVDLGDQVRIFIGCTASTAAACTTQAPRLINPTKTATLGTGDSWKIKINTFNAASTPLENTTIGIATIESVTVRATVDPTLSFTITGIDTGQPVNTGNTTGCLQVETTNSGINSTSNEVNLGTLGSSPAVDVKVSNIAAQRIDISTNGGTGYALTATSSSSLLNPESGFFLNASTTPSSWPVQTQFFGLHACGQDVPTNYTESGAGGSINCETKPTGSAGTTECRYAWPTDTQFISSTPLSIASDASGPIGAGSVDATGDGSVSISYAAGIDVSVPPGEYRSVITYIATPSF